MRHAESAGIPRDTPWYKLTAEQKHWVIHGTPNYREGNWNRQWYGVKRFFEYLESKAYKMHIRVLLSKYRSYTPCEACGGARLKTESAAVAPGQQGGRRRRAGARAPLHAGGRAVDARAAGGAARACRCTT